MGEVIILDKSVLKNAGLFVGAALLALALVYVVKKKIPKSTGFEVVSIERADAEHLADRDRVTLKDGTLIGTVGYGLKSHGALVRDREHAALILSGLECQDCGAVETLLIHVLPDSRTIPLPYPGQVYDPPMGDRPEGELAQESRVFYGECVADSGQVLLISRNAREAGGVLKRSLTVMGFREDGSFSEIGHEENPAQIAEIVQSAEKHCHEIAGRVFKH